MKNANKTFDDQGKELRGNFFPFHIERRTLTGTAALNSRSRSTGALSRSIRSKESFTPPTTYMIVDYRQDEEKIITQAETELRMEYLLKQQANKKKPLAPITPVKPSTTVMTISSQPIPESLPSSPVSPTRRSLTHGAQPLRSSFILKQKGSVQIDLDVSQFLFNKNDESIQTKPFLERADLPHVTDYQKWSNEIVEPFIKVLKLFLIYQNIF